MRMLVIVGLVTVLAGACVSKPAPWKPDGNGDDLGDSGTANADGMADVAPGDLARQDAAVDTRQPELFDASLDVTEKVDVVSADSDSTVADTTDADYLCQPQCDDKQCGDDGCGGSCGECGEESVCIAGQCELGVLGCDGIACPLLDGFDVTCNTQSHCEYANEDNTGWKEWDLWIWIPQGVFAMGSPTEEPDHQDAEWPLHNVTFKQGFFIAKYEIVVEQYEACTEANPSKCSAVSTADWDGEGWGTNSSANGRSLHPQNGLTWQQAKDFCAWVAPNGRLPSEAEWEYAAKGPLHQEYPWGDSPKPTCENDTAVFNEAGVVEGYGCDLGGTLEVGSKTAGASWSGALDMSGNLWEWCEDRWHENYQGAPVDGSAWVDTGIHRVVRGGSFDATASNLRSAWRPYHTPTHHFANDGARCVRPLLPEECVSDCDGKVCGDDGCGGSCGECPDVQDACIEGQCICQPACDGNECGDDGCGGVCGTCVGPQAKCVDGACICEPICVGKLCGDDGCGGSCGACETGYCSEEHFACVPPGWVVVVGDDFWMGSPGDENCRQDIEGPKHLVTISNDLMVSDHEVTHDEWKKIAKAPDPSWFSKVAPENGCLLTTCPVERVNWYEALHYCNILSLLEGLKPCYTLSGCEGTPGMGCEEAGACDAGYSCEEVGFEGVDCAGYRLPTEAEWEFLARAETTTAFPFPPPDGSAMGANCSCESVDFLVASAWYCQNSGSKPHGVKLKNPNAWGLHDMAGNVGEWCFDEYDINYYTDEPKIDPLGGTGNNRSVRGGNWHAPPSVCRSAQRASIAPEYRSWDTGFRVVRSLTGCIPNCLGKNCGDDGCGGLCGECNAPNVCVQGLCGIECDDDNDVAWDGCTDGLVTEFQVNETTDGIQDHSKVAVLDNGSFVVTWTTTSPSDGSEMGVSGRLFGPDGFSVGNDFLIGTYLDEYQAYSSVAPLAGGGFVVVWQGDKQDGSSWGVFGQRFGNEADKNGSEFQINTEAYGGQEDPDVVRLSNGGFVVAWNGGGNPTTGVFAQVFSSDGFKVGPEYKVGDSGRHVSIAPLPDSQAFVVWDDDGILGRLVSSSTGPLAGVLQVSPVGQDSAEHAAVTALSTGGWNVAWEAAPIGAQPLTPAYVDDIHLRQYDSDGVPQGEAQVLNEITLKGQRHACLVSSNAGTWAAFWLSGDQPGTNESGIYGRLLDDQGDPVGPEFRVSTNTDGNQELPAAAFFADGSFIVTWTDDSGIDGNVAGVFAQRFDENMNKVYH